MYKLEYSPVARQDMLGIILYISKKPTNPSAADRPAVDLTEAAEKWMVFPCDRQLLQPFHVNGEEGYA